MNKILVIVRGGNVEAVMSTKDCEVAIVDWDNIIEGGETRLIEYTEQEGVVEYDLDFQIEFANASIRENQKND